MSNRDAIAWLILAGALIVRLALVAWAGNSPQTPLTGGSDTVAYQALADSLMSHRGLSYYGSPTALRPPLYPMFLVLCQFIARTDYRLLVRLIQVVAAMLMGVVSARTTKALGGSPAVSAAAALAAPTLVFFSAELLSETLGALIVAAFLFVVVTEPKQSPMWVGLIIGLGMLERFNLTTLAVAYTVYQIAARKPSQAVRHIALAGLAALAITGPWFMRNLVTFQGQVLYSTHTGTNLLQGVITPDGRTQPGDVDKIAQAAGWRLSQIERNSPIRAAFPPEPQLDRMARDAALRQLGQANLFALTVRKLAYFWLSFDQLFRTQGLPRYKRLVRDSGVLLYWFLLIAAIAGWRTLRTRNRDAAILFVSYAILVTCMHIPFVMSTRMRAPLIEPALAILAGIALGADSPLTKHVATSAMSSEAMKTIR